jgi:hypothetical protein
MDLASKDPTGGPNCDARHDAPDILLRTLPEAPPRARAADAAVLWRLVVGKLTFTPKLNGDYEFAGRGTVRPLLAGEVRKLASPTGGRDTYEPGPREAYELPLCGTVHKAA